MEWTSFQLDDDVSFVDVVTTDAPGRFSRLTTWPAYRGTLDDRCDEPPALVELREVASYRPS